MHGSKRIALVGALLLALAPAACSDGGVPAASAEPAPGAGSGEMALGPVGSVGGALAAVMVIPGDTGAHSDTAAGADTAGSRPSGRGGMMGRGMMGHGMGRGMMGGGMMGGAADTAAAPRTSAVAASAAGCPQTTQPLVDEGRQVFTGAGNCYSCHGANAQGTALAPNLTDSTWLDADGSYGSIAGVVRTGVPHPRRFPTPMPAKGGAALSSSQVCAVAAYVFSLGHQ